MKKFFQGESYGKVNSRPLYAALFSFALLTFLLLLSPQYSYAGQVTLTWNAPTTNGDGSPITYFTGSYRIYYGTISGNYPQVTNLSNSNSIVTQQVANLNDGQLYYFVVTAVNILGNESGYSNEISKTAQSGTSPTYTITATAGQNGTISPSGVTTVNSAAKTWFIITPNTGYHIAAISGCGGTNPGIQASDAAYVYTTGAVAANCAVTASFAINPYVVSFSFTGSGAMTCTPSTLTSGGSFQCSLYPASGYHLQRLIDNAADVTGSVSNDVYSVVNVTASHNVIAAFQQNPLVLRLSGAAEPYIESWYPLIQDAYNSSSNTDDILIKASDVYENLVLNRNISIVLRGGYDADFYSVTGFTTMHGAMTISGGTVEVDRLVIR